MADINVEEELQKASKEMDKAEDDLIATGFPAEQWAIIERYISSAIRRQEMFTMRAAQNWKG